MPPRPAKRQRRSTLVSDDSDAEQDVSSTTKTFKKGSQREITADGRTSATTSPAKASKPKPTTKKTIATASPVSSPEKARKTTKLKAEPVKSKSLHTFFGKATDEQRWRKKSQTPDLEVKSNGGLSDDIEDDDLSDETLQELGLKQDASQNVLDRRKPGPLSSASRNISNGGSIPSSQKFIKPMIPAARATPTTESDDGGHRPWADRYGPTNLEELAVHKKKVTDVQGWLQGTRDARSVQKLLVLKGPAGSGKTTTLSLLAKALHLTLISWQNPMASELGAGNSVSAQFDDFLNRGGQLGSLTFEQQEEEHDLKKEKVESPDKVLVVEEFPATITRSSTALHSFRSVILQFLARAKASSTVSLRGQPSSGDVSPPVVIIISETLLSSSTALSDSFTAHRLLGPDILNHHLVTTFDFNPIAPTLMSKALDVVIKKEARDSRRRRMPGPAVMTKLAEIGDIRSAVNSLEFLCLRSGDNSEWSGTVAAKAKRTANSAMTEMEKNSLALVSQRETTLDMFHATGKIVYNKRGDPRALDTRAQPPPKPPDHLMHLYRPKVPEVDIEALLSETGTDIQTFISTVHENYVLSCYSDSFEECFEGCSDALSVSDILNPENRPNRRGNNANPNLGLIQSSLQSMASDALRQDEISFHVATRGLLFSLPFPVNRGAACSGTGKQNAYRMFYPANLRLWKPIEEMHGLLDTFVFGGGDITKVQSTHGPDTHMDDAGPEDQKSPYPILAQLEYPDQGTLPAIRYNKDTLTLEMLPLMTRIFTARQRDTTTLDKITKFKPSNALSGGDEGFEDEDDLKIEPKVNGAASTQQSNQEPPAAEVEKLFIVEDDIEDD